MSSREDNRLVEYLYGEMPEEKVDRFRREVEADPQLKADLEASRAMLQRFRDTMLVEEEPPSHLDVLILAHARQAAGGAGAGVRGEQRSVLARLRRLLSHPAAGLVTAASLALLIAAVTVPVMKNWNRAATPDSTLPRDAVSPTTPESVSATQLPNEHPSERSNASDSPRAKLRRSAPKKTLEAVGAGRAGGGLIGSTSEMKTPEGTSVAKEEPARKAVDAREQESGSEREEEQEHKQKRAHKRQQEEVPTQPSRSRTTVVPQVAAPAVAPARSEDAPRGDDVDVGADVLEAPRGRSHPYELAETFIHGAELELAQRKVRDARRILDEGLTRTRGTLGYGAVLLRLAQLEQAERREEVALRLAKRAAEIVGFRGRSEAIRLVLSIAERLGRQEDVAAARRELDSLR